MRLAIAGKGGVGKTTIAATAARLLARDGRSVLAVDADSNPNLAAALGVAPPPPPLPLPPDLLSRRLAGPRLARPLADVLAELAVGGPDGVRLVQMGLPQHAGAGCLCTAHAVVGALLQALDVDAIATVVDLEATPEHLARGTARHVDAFVIVTEVYYRALEATARLAALAGELGVPRVSVLANKLRGAADEQAVHEFCERHGLTLLAALPRCEAVLEADVAATPALDRPDAHPFVAALAGALPALWDHDGADASVAGG